jgi:hypothetical protein
MTQGQATVRMGEVRNDVIRQRRMLNNNCYEVEALTAEPYPENQTENFEVMVSIAPVGENIRKEKIVLSEFMNSPLCH